MESAIHQCENFDCKKEAKMHCPTCIKLELTASYFCGQECFKFYWPIHKIKHVKKDEASQSNYKFSGPLRPGKVSAKLFVPEHIKRPDYAYSSIPTEEINSPYQKTIVVNDYEDIQKIREVCKLGRDTLDFAHSLVKEGVTTDEIDRKTHQFIIDNDAYPSPLNYHKFPKSICTSVNEVICHGIPDDRKLQDGDIVNIDISVYKFGFHSDLNETYMVGNVSDSSKFLLQKTYQSLQNAIDICKPGAFYRDVGNVIAKYIEDNGLSVTRTYTGHGVGKLFHCAPNVPHYRNNKATGFMKAGHVFTIEPMINQGTYKDMLWDDGWTAVTADGQRSAQFEHTILITEGGCEVLTQRNNNSPSLLFI